MDKFTTAYRQLNTAQRSAVDAIEGPVLVIAGPGTGKTHVLTLRIANILANTDTSAQNILCLTFTDSAVQTMRSRLTTLVGLPAQHVNFNTYHAFGSDLIRRYPEYFAVTGDEKPVDELGISIIISDILDRTPFSNPLKRRQASVNDVRNTISELKRALLTPDQVRKIAAANRLFIEEASRDVSESLSSFQRMSKQTINLFEELAAKTKSIRHSAALPVPSIKTIWQEELDTALHAANDSGKTTPLTEWKNKWLAKNSENMYIVSGLQTVELIDALADIYDLYLNALKKAGLYDYDDMILRAIEGLETYPELRYTLQEQYLYIMLDEFQDTNKAQMRLVELLADNPVNEGRPNVMAVGDDDQAIFAFQGAHYSHMLRFKELYKDVTVISLIENYRSHRDVLSLADSVAIQINQRLIKNLPGSSKQLIAANKELPDEAEIDYRHFSSNVAQFAWIAEEVKRLHSQGMPLSDTAIIAPQHKYLEPMVTYLHQLDLPVRYEKRENILDDPVIKQYSVMTELILALKDDNQTLANSLWPEVLSYPYWGIPTSDIWQMSWTAHDSRKDWTTLMIAGEKLRVIALFFIKLSLIADTENLETLLDYLTGSQPLEWLAPDIPIYNAPLYSYFAQSETEFWRLMSNLTVLRDKLRSFKSNTEDALSLQDYNEFVAAYKEAGIKLLNTSPYNEAADAVQLLTVYKAKGQEFAAVFVAACIEEAWGTKAKGQSSRIPLPPNLQFVRYAGLTDDERIRLLFVAITRAKYRLYMTSYSATIEGKPMTRLSYLDTASNIAYPADAPSPNDIKPGSSYLEAYWRSSGASDTLSPDTRALLDNRLSTYMLSPTHLNSFTDVIYGGPELFYRNTILRFPKAPTPTGQYGNAIHETLEWLHTYNRRENRIPSSKLLKKHFQQRLAAKRLSPHHYELLIERGLSCLDAYYNQRRHTISADYECEKPFYNEGVFLEKAHLSGKIDKLIVERNSKSITIVDYKTGKSFSRWNNSDAKLHKYRQQLYFYKLLVEGSKSFAGYTVTDAYLEFVEPNDDGKITELHLEFNEEYMVRTKMLIGAVWQHIHSLIFPPIDSYPASAKGIVMLEDDLLNGKV